MEYNPEEYSEALIFEPIDKINPRIGKTLIMFVQKAGHDRWSGAVRVDRTSIGVQAVAEVLELVFNNKYKLARCEPIPADLDIPKILHRLAQEHYNDLRNKRSQARLKRKQKLKENVNV